MALTLPREKARLAELVFAAVFSTIVLVAFYALTSMNGLVLGNDPAVHLERAQLFLQTGQIPLANIGWTPPLFQILLATLISFTGATTVLQMIFLVKATAAVISWLLVFSVYLMGAKFFGRKVGATAAVLLLLCFPMYEVNMFGGYTTVLALAFMILVLLYTLLTAERFAYLPVTFLTAFALVLSHQLAAFLAVFIMPPILLFMLIKSKGAHLKVVFALILGGGIAFFLYYFQAMIGYLDMVIYYVFFAIKTYTYQIPAASFNELMVGFGFILFFALVGIVVAYHLLRAQKKMLSYLTLMLSFFVPFFFAESYLLGLYLPFQWFIYYLLPAMAILAAVTFVFAFNKLTQFYTKNRGMAKKLWAKATAVLLIVLVASMFIVRFEIVYGKITEASVFYSTSDLKALEAGTWLKNNYPGNATVVVTQVPGFWFQVFSGKNVTAATDPVVQRNLMAESVLNLAYEMQNPQTLLTGYEAKGDVTDETSVLINDVWKQISSSSGAGDFISYNDANGVYKYTALSNFTRTMGFTDDALPGLQINYTDETILIAETIAFQNDSYPINVGWSLSALRSEVANVTLYVTASFSLAFNFDKAYLPGLLNWQNPWADPTLTSGAEWATKEFNSTTLTGDCLGFYDGQNDVTFALKFDTLPEWGNVGALASMQIDAVRFQYHYDQITPTQPSSFAYQVVTFSQSSNPSSQALPNVANLFTEKVPVFDVQNRSYLDYVRENDVKFIVYDKNQLDTKMMNSKLLELIYSNDRYVIFKIKDS
jgi:asparagine N-glycosylation enzyme membrane subunit Stt3